VEHARRFSGEGLPEKQFEVLQLATL